jgi:serine phosphatase RsbU (regulator of sigma subunit)
MRQEIDETEERARAEAVATTGLPGMDPSERYDKITRAAREAFGVPLALVNLVDDQAIETISPQPDTGRWVTPFGAAFCEYTVRQDDILTVPDTAEDERFRDRPAVVSNGIRFYAGIPLHLESGTAVGTLCLLDTSPHTMSNEEEQRLRTFAEWAQHAVQGSAERSTREATRARASIGSERRGDLEIHTLDMPWGDASGDFHTHAAEDALVNASLGDVMGKGERARRLGALIASGLDRVDPSPGAALAAAQAVAHESVSSQEAFATLVHLVVDPGADRVRFVDAGHGLTVHVARDGGITRLSSSDLPFGLQEIGEDWHEHEIGLAPGEALISVSDGVLDLYDGTLAGLDALADDYRASADAEGLLERVQRRAAENPPIDDITVLVVARPTVS